MTKIYTRALPIKDDAPAREGVNYADPFPGRSFPLHSIFTHPFGHSRPVYDAPSEGGAGDPPADPPAPVKKDPPAGDPPAEGKKQPTDEEARLLKDLMKHKTNAEEATARLTAFGDVTPEQVQEMLAERRAAAEQKTADELAQAEARGEFDRVKASMSEQHAAALEAERAKAAEKDTALSAAQATISELTVGTAFGNSAFVREKTVYTGAKARTIYGAHFDTVGTQVVGYDKPRGAADRTPLVDAAGKNLPFEAAIAKLVELDPEKDHVLRSTMPAGAKSGTTDDTKAGKKSGDDASELKGTARIRAALQAKKDAVRA